MLDARARAMRGRVARGTTTATRATRRGRRATTTRAGVFDRFDRRRESPAATKDDAVRAPGARAEAIDALERSMAMASVRAEVDARDESGRGKRKAVMAGNWKLNPKTLDEARTLAALVGAAARDGGIGTNKSKTEVFVCPPAPFAAEVARTVRAKRLARRDATKRNSIRIERG